MKIVNKQEFYSLPEGTLYSGYEPTIFDGLKIKGVTIYDHENTPIDYRFEDLIGNVECNNSCEHGVILINAQNRKTSFKLDFDCSERDGMYEEELLYAIYEDDDVAEFIKRLEQLKKAE